MGLVVDAATRQYARRGGIKVAPRRLIGPGREKPDKLVVMSHKIIHVADFNRELGSKFARRSNVDTAVVPETTHLPTAKVALGVLTVADLVKYPRAKPSNSEMLKRADNTVVRLINHDDCILSTSDLELHGADVIGNIITSMYFDIGNSPDVRKLVSEPGYQSLAVCIRPLPERRRRTNTDAAASKSIRVSI